MKWLIILTGELKNKSVLFNIYFLEVVFHVTPTLLRSYGDFPAFTGGGRPKVPLCTLFQDQAKTPSRTTDVPQAS